MLTKVNQHDNYLFTSKKKSINLPKKKEKKSIMFLVGLLIESKVDINMKGK